MVIMIMQHTPRETYLAGQGHMNTISTPGITRRTS